MDLFETIWFKGVLPTMGVGATLGICLLSYGLCEHVKQDIISQKSKIIIPNITRDAIIDSTEKANFHDLTNSLIKIYNGKQNKISSFADINGDGHLDQKEKVVLHNTIDSTIESYNTKSEIGAPTNDEKSNLYKIIDSVNKRYNSEK